CSSTGNCATLKRRMIYIARQHLREIWYLPFLFEYGVPAVQPFNAIDSYIVRVYTPKVDTEIFSVQWVRFMVQYSRLGKLFITLLSFLFLSSALPASLASQRILQVLIGGSTALERRSIIFYSPIRHHSGGCRDVYQHNCPLRRGASNCRHHRRSPLCR